MPNFRDELLNCLKGLKGSGKFVTSHTADFVLPGLVVEGAGEVAFPVNEAGAKALIAVAQQAPFGKGSETIVDTAVRKTWEIDASLLAFRNSRWASFLNSAIAQIKPGLGLEEYDIEARLYKLLVYEPGGFFLPHRDSEKEKGMFGTLVVELPAAHTGGELVVSFEGIEEVVSFLQDSGAYGLRFAAFYADCEHEIRPVTSGYRVSLVYNLIQKGRGRTIALASIASGAERLAELIKVNQQEEEAEPIIVLLGHQYTPENFSVDALKLNDRPKAEALLQAARKAGCYAGMCLVTSYLFGSPDWGGYDEEADDAEMGEVIEESLTIEHWAKTGVPPLRNVMFDEEDLIASAPLNEGEPIVKENTGYMGNYGPDLMHWYHYGAVMIWSPEVNARLLPEQDAQTKLEWIAYLTRHREQATSHELAAVRSVLAAGAGNEHGLKELSYEAVADWIINEQDREFFLRVSPVVTQSYFVLIDAANWLKLLQFLGPEASGRIIGLAMQSGTLAALEQLLGILRLLAGSSKADTLMTQQLVLLPRYFSAVLTGGNSTITAPALHDLLWLEARHPQPAAWPANLAAILTGGAGRKAVHQVLAPELLALSKVTPLSAALLRWCESFLRDLVDNKPQPPADWSREMPDVASHRKEWALLKEFLASPHEQVFDYRKVQAERNDMENAISKAQVDLKTETIRKGSPHTLRIIKTQADYERRLRKWQEDAALLDRIAAKAEGA